MKFIFAEKEMVAWRYCAFVGGVMLSNGEEMTFKTLEDKSKESLIKKARSKGYFESKNGYIIGYARGHLYELKLPEEFNEAWSKWTREELPMIPEGFIDFAIKKLFKPKKELTAQINQILTFMRDCDEIIVATDNDREGESIFRIPYIFSGSKKPFVRAWLQDQTPEKIAKVFKNLEDGHKYDGWWYASVARTLSDWLVGMNLTRSFTIKSGSIYHIGRVKTPTLAIVVKRDLEIANFVPENFYLLEAKAHSQNNEEFALQYQAEERIKDRKVLEKLVQSLGSLPIQGIVKKIEGKMVSKPSPKLYNLTTLTKDASTALKFDAKKTLSIAEDLYLKHSAISYPRSDCEYLPSTMLDETKTVLHALMKTNEFSSLALSFKNPSSSYMNDAKMDGSHYAIVPTVKPPKRSSLTDDEWSLYSLICRRFLGMFMKPFVVEESTVTTDIQGHVFTTSGKVVRDLGWRVLYPESKTKDVLIPNIHENEHFSVSELTILDRKTTPPKPFTDGELVAYLEDISRYMEKGSSEKEIMKQKKGIGTTATRAEIINSLVSQGYLSRKQVVLQSTEIGREAIRNNPIRPLTEPELTAKWEEKLSMIESKKYDHIDFLKNIVIFIEKSIDLVDKSTIMNIRPNESKSSSGYATKKNENTGKQSSPSLGRCVCGGSITSTPKLYRCTDCSRVVWINTFEKRGKKTVTKKEAVQLLSGKSIEITLHSTAKNVDYKVNAFLDDSFRLQTEFVSSKKEVHA